MFLEQGQLFFQFFLDLANRIGDPLFRGNEMLGRVNKDLFLRRNHLTRQRFNDRDLFNLISPELDSIREFFISRPDFY